MPPVCASSTVPPACSSCSAGWRWRWRGGRDTGSAGSPPPMPEACLRHGGERLGVGGTTTVLGYPPPCPSPTRGEGTQSIGTAGASLNETHRLHVRLVRSRHQRAPRRHRAGGTHGGHAGHRHRRAPREDPALRDRGEDRDAEGGDCRPRQEEWDEDRDRHLRQPHRRCGAGRRGDADLPGPARWHRLRLRDADGWHELRHGAGDRYGVPAGEPWRSAHHGHAGAADRPDGRRRVGVRAGWRRQAPQGQGGEAQAVKLARALRWRRPPRAAECRRAYRGSGCHGHHPLRFAARIRLDGGCLCAPERPYGGVIRQLLSARARPRRPLPRSSSAMETFVIRLVMSLALILVALAAPASAQAPDPQNTLVIETTKGNILIRLRPDLAPKHVAQVKRLAKDGFYNGIIFHRVIAGFMAQTGDPTGTGTGGSKLPSLPAEFSQEPYKRGSVGA